jgi:replicative DNA helicase
VNGSREEVFVVIIATDEPRHGFLSRIGQYEGLSREDLDSEDKSVSGHAWSTVADRIRNVPNLAIFDSCFEDVTVDDVAEYTARKAHWRRAAVVIDSLHTAPFRCDQPRQDERARLDARSKALTNLTTKHRLCVLATSELNRASYKNQEQAALLNDLAAFKGSSAVEHAADLALLFRSVPGEANKAIDVTIAKNRLGTGATDVVFRLERGSHLSYREIE